MRGIPAAPAALLILLTTGIRAASASLPEGHPFIASDSWLAAALSPPGQVPAFQRGISFNDSASASEFTARTPLKPASALLISGVIPGAAQIRGGELRGYIMLGAELGAWFAYRSLRTGGQDRKSSSERMAKSSFSLAAYHDSALAAGANPDSVSQNLAELEQIYQDNPSDYYESIGKRDDLSFGWSDFKRAVGGAGGGSSQQGLYALRRDDGNRLIRHANALLSGILVNHIVSAFDAYRAAKNYQRELPMGVRMNLHMDPLAGQAMVRFSRSAW